MKKILTNSRKSIYAVAFLAVAVFVVFYIIELTSAKSYQIDFGENNYKTDEAGLSIDEYPFSEKFGARGADADGKTFVEIVGSPINLLLNYPSYVPRGITVSALVKDLTDLEISPVPNDNASFHWKVFGAEQIQSYAECGKAGDYYL